MVRSSLPLILLAGALPVIVASQNEEPVARALAAQAAGQLLWNFTAAPQNAFDSKPALSADNATLFIGSGDDHMYALKTKDGSVRWKFATGWNVDSSPILSADGKTLFFGGSDMVFYALKTADGALKWKYKPGHKQHASPIECTATLSDDGATVFYGAGNYVYALKTADGSVVWKYAGGGDSSPTLSADGKTLYIGSGTCALQCPLRSMR
jgi:outer membrane protein assembly factor BamB